MLQGFDDIDGSRKRGGEKTRTFWDRVWIGRWMCGPVQFDLKFLEKQRVERTQMISLKLITFVWYLLTSIPEK